MKLLAPVFAYATCTLLASSASAHISLDQGDTHKSRYGGDHGFIKEGPCGVTGGTRGENVYTYEPGETITLTAVEYIRHPGYFRIAFDDDGNDDFVDPATVDPINRECMPDPIDKCGADDFYNNDTVLMDNLDPHNPTIEELFKPLTYTWSVTLPDVECDNCTLQLIQVMTDAPGIHAPYDPSGPNPDDIYFQCIDLVLKAKSGGPGGSGSADAGAANPGNDGDDSGCAVAAAPRTASHGALVAGFGVALGAALRRRRSRTP